MRKALAGIFLACASLYCQATFSRPATIRNQPAAAPATVAPAPAAISPEDKCSVEGTVVNAVTGEPLNKARLTLQPIGAVNGTGFGASSDAAGHFLIDGVDPGRYMLSATRNLFLNQTYSPQGNTRRSAALTLSAGQHLKDVVFKLTPQGVIAGRVLDEDGEPVQGVMVQVLTYRYQNGQKQLQPSGGSSTNDLGEFRLYNLRPGKYVLSANYQTPQQNPSTPGSSQQALEEGYAITFFPNTTSPDSASQIEVTPGSQIQGVSITLLKTRTVRITGRLNGSTDIARRTQVLLFPRGAFLIPMMRGARLPDASGNFEIRGVPPGSYTLQANHQDGATHYSASIPIEVGNSDIEGLELNLQPPGELSGRIVLEDNGNLSNSTLNVLLSPVVRMSMSGNLVGQVKDDLTFKIENLIPQSYSVVLNGLPPGYYLKSVRLGDQDLTYKDLDFSQAPPSGELTFIVNPKGGEIDGTVQNSKGDPAAAAMVTLIPDASRRSVFSLYKTANTDQNGNFSIKGIAPGDYTLYAWEEIEPGAYQDPDFLKPHESEAQAISIKEGDRQNLQLKAIPAEETQSTGTTH